MKGKLKVISFMMCLLFSVCMAAGCGETGGTGGRGKVTVTVWAVVNESNNDAMREIVTGFNESSDRYKVSLVPKTSGYSATLGGALKASNPPSLVQIDDRYYKGYINEGYLTDLTEYFADKLDEDGNVVRAKSSVELSDIWDTAVSRYRYNAETGYSGGSEPLYGLPTGITPGVMYYNKTSLQAAGVNLISIKEEDIADRNEADGTAYLGRGFHIYDEAPAQGLTQKNGKYYVFNNKIPMNWDELVEIATFMTKSYNSDSPTNYGFFNEWWFSFGWSVGGDCLEWDDEKGQYVFALGETTPNYLVTGSGATVNGTSYRAGEILSYADKHFVEDNKADSAIEPLLDDGILYLLPSIRDAFTLFLQLSQKKGANVTDDGLKQGLAVSPTPAVIGDKSKQTLLTSREAAFVVENFSETRLIGKQMAGQKLEWDIAPLYQYREYDENGALKTVNGTPVLGKMATHSNGVSFAIPQNAKAKDGAFKFLEYMLSEEVQKILAKANLSVPALKSLAYSDEYASMTDNFAAANKDAVLSSAACSSVGDWSYLENGSWVNTWANVLNTDVRNGKITLDGFFAHSCIEETNAALALMKAKKFNG